MECRPSQVARAPRHIRALYLTASGVPTSDCVERYV